MIAPLVAAARPVAGHPVWHYLVVPVVGFGVFIWLKISERRGSDHGPGVRKRAAAVAISVSAFRLRRAPATRTDLALAACSAGSGLIHLGVCPAHFREAFVFGVFFVVAASLQVAWAALVWNGPSRRLLWLGAAGNAGVLLLWALSRTVGLPIGPDVWHPEAIGAQDILASFLELTFVVVACRVLMRRGRAQRAASPASLLAPAN